MALGIIIYTIFSASLVLSGGAHGNSSSKQQAINTIETENGQIYHCVDFYKQPTFNHASLRNLRSQMTRARLASLQERKFKGIGLKGGGCPSGTVPILRVNSDDAMKTRALSNSEEHCTAVVRTRANDPNKKFLGSDASPSIYKPQVQNGQWSSSRIKLLNGPDSIEGGWMVNPDLFKDKEAHLYAKFTAGGSGCINLQCTGFVQVSKDIPLGYIPEKYSTIGGQLYTWNISIDKHQDDGNWWLSLTHDKVAIGYWPKSLFTGLTEVANQIEWGGEIDNPGQETPVPDMGNGYKAAYSTKKSSFFHHVSVLDDSFHYVNPQDTEKYVDCTGKYIVLDADYQGDEWGRLIFYGGPADP